MILDDTHYQSITCSRLSENRGLMSLFEQDLAVYPLTCIACSVLVRAGCSRLLLVNEF